MANQKPQFGPEWQRVQMLKQNTVRVRFEDLNPIVQVTIGKKASVMDDVRINDANLKTLRRERSIAEGATAGYAVLGAMAAYKASTNPGVRNTASTVSAVGGLGSLFGLAIRQGTVEVIQKRHQEIAEYMDKYGVLQTHSEKEYPPGWLNPTMVAETHPIFSVQGNGDIIFRRVTRKEFWLLKRQEKWIGKAGVNLWRWRGTLRKPLAPEVERQKTWERVRKAVRRLAPSPLPRPALQPARKAALFQRMRPRHR